MSGGPEFGAAHATGENWRDAAGEIVVGLGTLAREHRLGFVFVAEAFAGELADIEIFLRQTTGVQHWVGAAGPGVCGLRAEYLEAPAMSVLVAPIADDGFRIFDSGDGDAAAIVADNRAWLSAADPALAVVHATPGHASIQKRVAELAHESNAYLVGGLTAVTGMPGQIVGKRTGGGLSGVFLSSHAVPVAVGLTQGCSPIGPAHTVTRADGNILIELDEQPALEVFKHDIGEPLSRDLRQTGGLIFAALAVSGSDTGDYLVRNLMGIDPENGLVAIGDVVARGDRVMFCRRDGGTAEEDLRRMLDRLSRRAAGGIRGGLYYSCIARGPNQFGPGNRELGMIADTLGDFPIAGMFANGEINHDRLYGYTGVLTLFL